MKTSKRTVLVVEDAPSQAEIYASYLRIAGYCALIDDTGQKALTTLRAEKPDALVLDIHLPDMEGLDLLPEALALYPDLPVIIITADTTAELAAKAVEAGAYDYILKPFPPSRLLVTLAKALENAILSHEVREWRHLVGASAYHGFVGHSSAMQAVYRVIESVANSKASVFITGESGTGKELAARALHEASPRRSNPFVAINCGAIPANLLESHIFGHIKGSFTGAVANQQGAAVKADRGTLFLDEICEMPPELQVKLLRFLQTNEVTPVGSQEVVRVDIRVVAATNRDPLAEMKSGRFREDLYYRLHVVPLEMPPLKERDDDIVLLAEHFLEKFNQSEGKNFEGFEPTVLRLFRQFEWPGNVRQLENAVHRMIAINDGKMIRTSMLDDEMRLFPLGGIFSPPEPVRNETAAIRPLWLIEKEAILKALAQTDQDVAKAAALLDVSPSTLYRKLQAWKKEG
jgi:two-component system repressor protein LuxO